MLLFNTSETVYKEYPLNVDPLAGVDPSEIEQSSELNIDAAPTSLLGDTDFGDFDVKPLNFRPTIRDLPQLALPTSLDLPNVIDMPWDS